MEKPGYRIHGDGRVDIYNEKIEIKGIFPYVDGMPIVPDSVEKDGSSIRYQTKNGNLILSLRTEAEDVILSTKIEGFDGVHDIEPVGEAVLSGADHMYVQGFGMEGPSGYFPIDTTERYSHGIFALCEENAAHVIFSEDHRRFRTVLSAKERASLFTKRKTVSVGFNLEGTVSGQIVLPDLYFKSGTNVTDSLGAAAKQIAGFMDARNCMPPAYYWCSWYYYYENFCQDLLEQLLKEMHTDFRYIQIDAGYTPHIGDWLSSNHRYPKGLGKAAATILDAGYEAGIWIAPFLVGDMSELYLEHPDWIVRNKNQEPYVVFRSYTEPKIWGHRDNDYFILDLTHPEAFAYLKNVFQTLRGYGFTLFKTDFMLWSMVDSSEVLRYDNSLTSVEIMRRVLAMIREVIGEDSFLLGSIAPFMPFIGYADAMRIAGDNGAQWSEKYGPVNLLQELPYDNYFNHVFWQNDPDSMILRDFGTHLTEEETRSLALLQAVSGGVITTSDPIMKLSKDRLKWLQFLKPKGKVQAEIPYLTKKTDEIVLVHKLKDWNLLFVLNPTEQPVKVYYRLDELFGEKNWYQYQYDWSDDEEIVSEQGNTFFKVLNPHESALLFVTEKPFNKKPLNIWEQ